MLKFITADFYYYIHQAFWPFLRIITLISLAPLFSDKGINSKIKIGLSISITWLIVPTLPSVAVDIISFNGLWLGGLQLFIGMAMALTMQLVFVAARHAGELIGLQMGLSFATFYDHSGGQNMPVVARILNLLAILLFLSFNGHLLLIEALAVSFDILPLQLLSLSAEGMLMLVKFSDIIFSAGIKLALPVVSLLLCINLSLGLVNRLIPPLSIFVVGFPLSLSIGMLMLSMALYSFAPFFEQLLTEIFTSLSSLLLHLA